MLFCILIYLCAIHFELHMLTTRILISVGLLTSLPLSCQEAPAHSQQAMAASPSELPASAQTATASEDFLLGKFAPDSHPDFVKITPPQTDKPGMMLHREAAKAFSDMWQHAKKMG
jgi:hypothetical protein